MYHCPQMQQEPSIPGPGFAAALKQQCPPQAPRSMLDFSDYIVSVR